MSKQSYSYVKTEDGDGCWIIPRSDRLAHRQESNCPTTYFLVPRAPSPVNTPHKQPLQPASRPRIVASLSTRTHAACCFAFDGHVTRSIIAHWSVLKSEGRIRRVFYSRQSSFYTFSYTQERGVHALLVLYDRSIVSTTDTSQLICPVRTKTT